MTAPKSHRERYDAGEIDTTDHKPPINPDAPHAPGPIEEATGQHTQYWMLSAAERSKGFVRPVRRSYIHEKCGGRTTMGQELAETYARQPDFYGSTFCVGCGAHFRVGADGEFVWDGTSEKVGT